MTLIAVSPNSKFRSSIHTESTLKLVLSPNFLHGGFVLTRLTSSQGWGILDIFTRIKEGISSHYDIIQTFDHFPNIALPFIYLRGKSNASFVSDWCDVFHLPGGFRDTFRYRFDRFYRSLGFPFRNYFKNTEVGLRKKADAVTVISGRLRDLAVNYGIKKERITIVEGGVDTDKITPLQITDSRKKVGLPLEGRIIVFVGRSQFDLDILIRSFTRVRQDIRNCYLVIVGSNLHDWPKRLALDLAVSDAYIEVGHCPDEDLSVFLSSANVLALPMKRNLINETRWPNKIGEYMASGRPIVVSNVGDVPDVVERHNAGLVAEPNVDDFASKLKTLLENQGLASELGSNARRVACKMYTWHSMAKKLENVYLQILS